MICWPCFLPEISTKRLKSYTRLTDDMWKNIVAFFSQALDVRSFRKQRWDQMHPASPCPKGYNEYRGRDVPENIQHKKQDIGLLNQHSYVFSIVLGIHIFPIHFCFPSSHWNTLTDQAFSMSFQVPEVQVLVTEACFSGTTWRILEDHPS